MKSLFAAAFVFGLTALGSAGSASAQATDPKLDFLGLCIKQGSSSNYCACISDKLGAALTPAEFAVYNDYLKLVAGGQQDTKAIIADLTARHNITKKDLGRILQAATDITSKPETCAGL
ncbi:hypothetical protein sos41_00110 [Alphaproteobacteria bacterium SO-S41]|nr:hypothetical protein sos41_00110 [Alphaproteobacteria bacterium SO-S41]